MNLCEQVDFSIDVTAGNDQTISFLDPLFIASSFVFYSTDKSVNSSFPFGAGGVFFFGYEDAVTRYSTGFAVGGFGPEHVWSDAESITACRTAFSFEFKVGAYVKTVRAGSFDIHVNTLNINTGMKWTCFATSTRMQAKTLTIPLNVTSTTLTPGFTPIAMIGQWHPGASGGSFTGSGLPCHSLGFATSCGASQFALSNSSYKKYQKQGVFLSRIDSSGIIEDELTVTGWDNTSITLDATSTSGEYASALILGGGTFSANLGVFSQPSGTIVTLADALAGALFASFNHIHSNSVENGLDIAFGSTDGNLQESVWAGGTDNHPFDCRSRALESDMDTKVITLAHCIADFTSVIDGQASFTSFVDNNVNLAWNINDDVAREIIYLVFSENASDPPFCGTGGCCTTNKTRMEIELNGVRQAAAHFPNSEFSFSFLLEALKNDVINIKAFQTNGVEINMIPSVEIHRTAYVIHDKATGRNLEEPD